MKDRLTVLAWHNVRSSWYFPMGREAGPRGLERQLRLIREVADVVPLPDALAALDEGRGLPPRSVALTFDDGYRDVIENVVPMLEALELPATFFLVPGLLSQEVEPWWEVVAATFLKSQCREVSWQGETYRLDGIHLRRMALEHVVEQLKTLDSTTRESKVAELKERLGAPPPHLCQSLFLDWNGAEEIVRRGFTVGSHTMSHGILGRERAKDQGFELVQARRELETNLGVPITLLAYPCGRMQDYNLATIDAAKAAGYSHAFTTLPGVNQPSSARFELRRNVVSPTARLRRWVAVMLDVLRLRGRSRGDLLTRPAYLP